MQISCLTNSGSFRLQTTVPRTLTDHDVDISSGTEYSVDLNPSMNFIKMSFDRKRRKTLSTNSLTRRHVTAKLGLSLPAKACYARATHACIANCDTKNNKKECHRKLTSGCLARVIIAFSRYERTHPNFVSAAGIEIFGLQIGRPSKFLQRLWASFLCALGTKRG